MIIPRNSAIWLAMFLAMLPAIALPAELRVIEMSNMPPYQFPPEPVNTANASHWQWMQAFYDREVSQPASTNETLAQVEKRAARVKPTPEKLAYLDLELITFPHFGMSTVSGHQQGTGKENPASFNPPARQAAAISPTMSPLPPRQGELRMQ